MKKKPMKKMGMGGKAKPSYGCGGMTKKKKK